MCDVIGGLPRTIQSELIMLCQTDSCRLFMENENCASSTFVSSSKNCSMSYLSSFVLLDIAHPVGIMLKQYIVVVAVTINWSVQLG